MEMDPHHLVECCHPRQANSYPKLRESVLQRLKCTSQGYASHSQRHSASLRLQRSSLSQQSRCPSQSLKSTPLSCPTPTSLTMWMDPCSEQNSWAYEPRTGKRMTMSQSDCCHGIGAEPLMRGGPLRGRGSIPMNSHGSDEKDYQQHHSIQASPPCSPSSNSSHRTPNSPKHQSLPLREHLSFPTQNS